MRASFRPWRPVAIFSALFTAECASQPVNPSFSVSLDRAKEDLHRMAAHPVKLHRPLVIISGLMDPGFAAWSLRASFESVTRDSRIIAVSMGDRVSFDGCRRKLVAAVERAAPSHDPDQTVDVDVIGFSLGGVVARYAAIPRPGTGLPRLRIAHLFTISSPHQGADRAQSWPLLHPLQRDLRPHSPRLAQLDAAGHAYPIYSYVRLHDQVVGEDKASLPGTNPWWVSNPPLEDAHNNAPYDARILADIARRLRDEQPLAMTPAAPLPGTR